MLHISGGKVTSSFSSVLKRHSISIKYLIRKKLSVSRQFSTTIMAATAYARLPKVELHVHADGSCRVTTLQELSQQFNCPYPHDNLEEFRKIVTLPETTASLQEFLQVFDVITNILRTEKALERVAYEFCEDMARQNVLYAEYRFHPCFKVHMSGVQFCRAIFAGLQQGQQKFGVKVRCILCFMRDFPDTVPDVLALAKSYPEWVVGVDMAGDENKPLTEKHVDGFLQARQCGLHVTVHAGESGPASNVREAIEVLGAERIGHGYHVIDDEDIYKFAKERDIHFEVCPTSSQFTKAAELEAHAMKRFAKDGVKFGINTDDPGVMQIDLNGEYQVSQDKLGIKKEQLLRSVMDSAKATFLPEPEKSALVKTVREKLLHFDPTFIP